MPAHPEPDRRALGFAKLAGVAPDLGRCIVEFAFGDVHARPGLDLRSREIATVAALAALGNAAPSSRSTHTAHSTSASPARDPWGSSP